MPDEAVTSFCPHCGATDSRRLGPCKVCRLSVCERCGNIQHSHGERQVVHDECLKGTNDSFSMINIVK
jgi:hypothetical protein